MDAIDTISLPSITDILADRPLPSSKLLIFNFSLTLYPDPPLSTSYWLILPEDEKLTSISCKTFLRLSNIPSYSDPIASSLYGFVFLLNPKVFKSMFWLFVSVKFQSSGFAA